MPIDIKIEAIDISMTKKGTYIRNPIIKAVLSSDIMNAGIIVHIPKSSMDLGFGSLAALINRAKSCSDVCLSINSRRGLIALSSPSS